MKLRIKVSIAGDSFVLNPGDLTERFTGAEAARLIAAGFAEKEKPERAVKPPAPECREA